MLVIRDPCRRPFVFVNACVRACVVAWMRA
jgi:hypothetical protein